MPKKRPPGRPKSDAKNQQIFEAAVALFAARGYEETRIDEVAKRAGVSKQTVYSYFDSKDQLFAAAITFVCEQLGMPEGLVHDPRPAGEVLTEIGGQFLRLLLTVESRRLYRLVLSSVDRHPQVARVFYQTGPHAFIARLADFLKARSDAGELEISDPRLAAAQFFSMMRGELHLRAVLDVGRNPTSAEIDRYVAESARIFVRGYAPGGLGGDET